MAGKKKKKSKPRGKKALQKRINKIVIALVVIIVASFSITAVLWGRKHYEDGSETSGGAGSEAVSAAGRSTGEGTGKAAEGARPAAGALEKKNRKENPAEEVRKLKRNIAAGKMYRRGKGSIVIIIDDVGYNIHQLKPFLELPGPIVFAVLPSLPYSERAAELILKHGKEYIIHQPMEAVSRQNLGPRAILSEMETSEIERVLGENIASLPEAVGVNNHMGSKVTADPELMKTVARYLAKRGLLLIDSLTTPHSAIKKAVGNTGLPYIRRDVFLDNREAIEYYTTAFAQGKKQAEEEGYAVMIGHVQSEGLAESLRQLCDSAKSEGYTFIPASKIPYVIESYAGAGY